MTADPEEERLRRLLRAAPMDQVGTEGAALDIIRSGIQRRRVRRQWSAGLLSAALVLGGAVTVPQLLAPDRGNGLVASAPTASPEPTPGMATSEPAPTTAPTPEPTPASVTPLTLEGGLPLWPFSDGREAAAWAASRASASEAWRMDAEQTAVRFARDFLGFQEIDRATSADVGATEGEVGVGYLTPDGKAATTAVVHLYRYGTTGPWEVVGTRDSTLTLTQPAYGAAARSAVTAGGHITGVDEAIRVSVMDPSSGARLGTNCCLASGGENSPWTSRVSFGGSQAPILTVVASTGGHLAEVERFAVTAVRNQTP